MVSPDTDLMPSFSTIFLRWVMTVVRLMFSLSAISLLMSPLVMSTSTSMCYEFGMGQGDAVCAILEENGFTVLERTLDYNERERAVLAQYGRKGI